MIAGLLVFAAGNLASLLWARWLADRLKTGKEALDLVLLLLIRLALISTAVLAAGMTQVLTRRGLGLASGAALLTYGAVSGRRGWTWRPSLGGAGWMEVVALIVLLRLVLQAWFFAPHLGDAVAYHLPKIGEWVRQGGFTREMGLHPHVTFPAGFELVETWWVVLLRHDVLIEMAGVEYLILASVSVEALGRGAGLEVREARLGALIFALTPGLHLSATSCLNDVPAAALVLATAALVQARASLPLIAMTAGLGLGTKATYGYAMPGILLLAFLVRREPPAPAGSRACAWTLAAMGLLAGVFWYVRNVVWFGNPVFPVGEPGYDASGVAVQMGPRWASMLANARDLIEYRIYDQQTALGANVDDMAGWGAVVFSCGLPGLAPVLLQAPRLGPLAAGFVLSLACSLGLIVHDPWCLKYVFFFPALGALAAAAVAGLHRNLRAVVLAGLAFSFLGTFLPYDLPFPQFRALAGQGWRERTALPNPASMRGLDRVACFGGYRTRSALLYGPDYGRQVIYLRAREPEAFWRALEGSGAEVLYGVPEDSRQGEILAKGLQSGALQDLGGSLYRVVRR